MTNYSLACLDDDSSLTFEESSSKLSQIREFQHKLLKITPAQYFNPSLFQEKRMCMNVHKILTQMQDRGKIKVMMSYMYFRSNCTFNVTFYTFKCSLYL